MYLVARTDENGTYFQRLHALDITTGAEKFGGPVAIAATVPGNGAGSVNGMILFDPLHDIQRSGLLLVNGMVYIGMGRKRARLDHGLQRANPSASSGL